MELFQEILVRHYQRYPLMQIDDFLKLIYQTTFGPKHFNSQPNLEQVLTYIKEELKEVSYYTNTPLIEDVGNQYYRISLHLVNIGEMSTTELANMFLNSMMDSPDLTDDLKQQFLKRIDCLIELISNQQIRTSINESLEAIETYLKTGIQALHHGTVYQLNYKPHYRLVHHDYIPEDLIKYIK